MKLKPIEIDREPILQLADQNMKQGNIDKAIAYYQQFLSIKKPHPKKYLALHNLGYIYLKTNNIEDGFNLLQKAIEEKPNFIQSYLLIGDALFDLQQYDQAYDYYNEAIRIDPYSVRANVGMSDVCIALDREIDAIPFVLKNLELDPADSSLYDKLAGLYLISGEFSKALDFQLKSVAWNPTPEYVINLADVYKHNKMLDEALKCFKEVVTKNPDMVVAHTAYSDALLQNGDYLEGFKEYEWRRHQKKLSRDKEFTKPHWDGISDLTGKTILLYAEQGFGDTIQFVRYIEVFKEKYPNTKIIFECHPPLKSLFSQIGSISEIYEYYKAPRDRFDCHCSIMSLPHYFSTTIKDIPNKNPYLQADPEQSKYWADKIGVSSKLKVGLVWHGTETKELVKITKRRNIPLDSLLGMFDLDNIQLYNLQKGTKASDIQRLNLSDKIIDFTEEFYEFSDTAAFIDNLDLVIGVDTAVIHLACALGKNTWMFSRYNGCWRWLTEEKEGDRSPWYPTLRIYHQSKWCDWETEIARVIKDLRNYRT